jgi:hypothetical protein
MIRYLPVVASVVAITLAGFLSGNWSNRWGDATELEYAVAHVPKVAHQFGDWIGQDVVPTEKQKESFESAELRVVLMRSYQNRDTGEQVEVMLTCGPAGPVIGHSPDSCYVGAGYALGAPLEQVTIPGETGTPLEKSSFWVGDFRHTKAVAPVGLKIYWSWRGGKTGTMWDASQSPRFTMVQFRALYKLYVIRTMAMAGPSPVEDLVTPRFIEQLLPAVETAVFQDINAPSKAG